MRAVVVNSGNANACTGERGYQDALEMARLAAGACDAEPDQALVMSTGIIGKYLPMEKIGVGVRAAADRLSADEAGFLAAARGILTTDRGQKVAGRTFESAGQTIRIAGMAKGAGMIGPRMATMLSVVLTDTALTVSDAQAALADAVEDSFNCISVEGHTSDAQAALADAVEDSFNCISVEGHTSTNDSVLLLASGAGGPKLLAGEALAEFRSQLGELCVELARQIPDDGEGASHLITIDVRGTRSRDDAYRIAKTVADSALVKTAIAGGDPNWGRIVSAAGYSGVGFDPDGLTLRVNGTELYRAGSPQPFDERQVSASIRENRETGIDLQFGEGDQGVRFWTSDLTVDYVKFNADYHT
jgi:glutamate N-acetyltransferase/amino-acid N-acetyltransferase